MEWIFRGLGGVMSSPIFYTIVLSPTASESATLGDNTFKDATDVN